MKKKRVYVVPHSHWDREWYFTIEDSNVLLTENMPYLMNVLEKNDDFPSYTFDAQLSIVEEFLKLYPEEKERISNLIRDKRIFVGPWYTQTDSLLVNKESIIRNLLYGTRLGNSFGHSMNIGYLPDIFGQNAYLPSIFKGFGIEYSVLQRGLFTNDLKGDLNFKWTSPDGETIKANNIFLGYGPGKFLASDDKYINEKLTPMLEKLESLNNNTDNLLLPAGGDQVLVRTHFPKVIEELNKKVDKYEFILSDYESFMRDTWSKEFNNEINGELVACEKSRIHSTIKSQRYDIKKLNTLVENKILYILEPLSVIGKSLGVEYRTPWLDMMWKLLFDAHAHDSLGGCNSDETNKNIISRLNKVNELCDGLTNIVKKKLVNAISNSLNKDNIIVLFNTKAYDSDELKEAVIFTKNEKFKLEALSGDKVKFNVLNQAIISGGKQVQVTAEGEVEIELPGYYRSEILISNINVPSMGFETLLILDENLEENEARENCDERKISNYIYELAFNNGSISLRNKVTNDKVQDLISFENCGDYGDSYDFSPVEGETPIIINEGKLLEVKKCDLSEMMTVVYNVKLPKNLDERVKNISSEELSISTTFELRAEENFIRVTHNIENNIEDHRIRAILNTNIKSKVSISDEGFSAIERKNTNPYLENWKENKFAEAPMAIYSLENFAAIRDEDKYFAAIAKGIKEYEILEDSKIALTLFRSVGLLGRDNLPWRPGRASGINNKVVYTKDAQLKQNLNFEYAVYFDNSNEGELEIFKAVDKFNNKYAFYQKQCLNLFEERLERFEIPLNYNVETPSYSLFNVDNKNVFVSVCKESYEKDGITLRLFNPGNKEETAIIAGEKIKEIAITNLYEEVEGQYKDKIVIPAKGYVTLKLAIN